ncbi:MAG: adenylate/guanylate cyclase domain-containing protein [Gammaproteobacteria bacterium]|nr:adenylate/guanylate cyclase domain-containing protein [Gammaproteobacteria bacterium]MBU1623560.1 adenylate/guanylate cyclase domain-containing protein [Gammaproteobacteria bacterium]
MHNAPRNPDRQSAQHIGLAFMLLALLELMYLHALSPLENRLSDAFVRMQATALAPDPDIVIVDIDDNSLTQMENDAGRWPWPRAIHGELVQGIAAQQPKAIVFDILFSEGDAFRPDSDAAFNQALQGVDNVYFPMVRRAAAMDAQGAFIIDIAPLLGLQRGDAADDKAKLAVLPPLALDPEHWRVGTINFEEDADGVGRRYQLYTDAYGWRIPSLPARVAQDLGYEVPQQADLILAWRGKAGAFEHISYADLYADMQREKRQRPADELKDKIVIIGTAATGMHDVRVTPLASLYPGVEMLATAIDNLKNGRAMRRADEGFPSGLALLLIGVLSIVFMRGMNALKVGQGMVLVTVLMLLAEYFAVGNLMLLPVLSPLLLVWLAYVAFALRAYLRERKSREQAVQLFSRFVNPHVVQELVAHGGLSRQGESRQITILFSDIRGFTTLSEKRTPEQVVELLNRYFSLQVEVVFRHGGSLDKFIGDCIMAFWGAPLDDPDHAKHAVEAALEMGEVLQKFKKELGEEDATFDVGIGIHSGPAVVGLIGSEQRREYTAIGDTVNLGSRIEGLTKGVSRILVSRETMQACGDAFEFQSFGSFKVKGREQEVELFAPSRKGESA